jgi:hypothetical protein
MASKRKIRRRSCASKVRHKDAIGALITLKRNKMRSGPMHVYACKFCGGFHIGHKRRKDLF